MFLTSQTLIGQTTEVKSLTWDCDTEVLRVRDQQVPFELIQADACWSCTQWKKREMNLAQDGWEKVKDTLQ